MEHDFTTFNPLHRPHLLKLQTTQYDRHIQQQLHLLPLTAGTKVTCQSGIPVNFIQVLVLSLLFCMVYINQSINQCFYFGQRGPYETEANTHTQTIKKVSR